MGYPMIRFLKHHEIDFKKWDAAIESASNRLVYAQSWFLNIVSPDWQALVADDYASVMPLPVKYKFIFPYLIQPRFTQQLGIFSRFDISPMVVASFIQSIPQRFIWYDLNLNYANDCEDLKKLTLQDNYELDLNCSYDTIWANFNQSTRQNIKKSAGLGLHVEGITDSAIFLNKYFSACKVKPDKTGEMQLNQIVEQSMHKGLGKAYLVKDSYNEVIAGAFYLCQFNRLINFVSFTTNEGRESSAMFLLIDFVIKCNISQPVILDFEGSTIAGIAEFFRGFGGSCVKYPRLKVNILA
jgi:hypothetical protein